jgi:tripartite-type tricarboxylate transporter receptor subunit TctC
MNGRAIVMENRSGAGTFIPMQAVAQAPADGHTPALASRAVLATAPVMPGARYHAIMSATAASIFCSGRCLAG